MAKSKFISDAEQMQKKLGTAMCLAKWQQVSLHLGTGMTNSCYHPPLHEIDPVVITFNPSALHNTDQKKVARKQMLEGERPDECSYCWSAEDNGELSDRHYRSGEPWAAEHFEEIQNIDWQSDVIPSYVEVNFSNVCNLACSYCSPQYSTEWGKDIKRFGAYNTSTPHNSPDHFEGRRKSIPVKDYNPYVEAFWKWWPSLYPKLKHFRMTGGEPLMDKNTYKIFNYVLAAPNPELHLDVTSNFSVEEKLFIKYISKVKQICDNNAVEHFMQYISVDAGNYRHANYIRSGLDSTNLCRNLNIYLQEIPNRNSLTFIITMNNLSLLSLRQLLQYILALRSTYSTTYQRVWFDTPLLRAPEWQSIQILPSSYAERLHDIIEWMKENKMGDDYVGFKDYEIQRMERNLLWMVEGTENVEAKRADFYRFFSEYDKRRNLNFLATFPEMKDFWQECKYHSEQ